MRRCYIIDVCLTCGAHAVYPFICGHRPTRFDAQSEPWTVPVAVELTKTSETLLHKLGAL